VTEVTVNVLTNVYVERKEPVTKVPTPPRARWWETMRHTGRGWFARPLGLVFAFAGAACAGHEPIAPPGIFFPTVPIGDAYPAALMEGMLDVRSGCVFVSDHNESWLLLWPEGYTAQLADGRLDVLDESGDIVGREGGRLRVGGGESNPIEVGGEAAAERSASELTGLDILERCGDLHWIVSP
jgi:hypothetical protein